MAGDGDASRPATTAEQLAGQAQNGCRASFEELVRRFQVPLLHYLQQWHSACDAEDVLQDVFVRAYRELAKYDTDRPFLPWLFTITRRLSQNHTRRHRTCAELHDSGLVSADPCADVERREHVWTLAARELNEPQYTAVWLYYVEDMATADIARVLDCSRDVVKALLSRARRKLSPVLKAELVE